MTLYGITEDHEYNATHKRKRIMIWSAPFMSTFEGDALSLPKGDGYMINLGYGDKVRVECPVERTATNYQEQDKAINDALNRHRLEYLRSRIEAESISTYELIELQNMVEYIDSGDVQLLEWAGVPEFSEDEEESSPFPSGPVKVAQEWVRDYKPAYVANGKPVIRK